VKKKHLFTITIAIYHSIPNIDKGTFPSQRKQHCSNISTCTYRLIVLLMVMDWFGTNFCSKGVLWLALRGQPLPLICAAAIAILRYTINRRYVFDVTSRTTTFVLRTNHGYSSIVPEVFYTPNLACKAPSPTYTSQPFRLFVTNLRWLNKNRNHHDGTNKCPWPTILPWFMSQWMICSF